MRRTPGRTYIFHINLHYIITDQMLGRTKAKHRDEIKLTIFLNQKVFVFHFYKHPHATIIVISNISIALEY